MRGKIFLLGLVVGALAAYIRSGWIALGLAFTAGVFVTLSGVLLFEDDDP